MRLTAAKDRTFKDRPSESGTLLSADILREVINRSAATARTTSMVTGRSAVEWVNHRDWIEVAA